MGATATGKTDLAVEIASRFPVELISVDSALIYRGMNIGTAKPDNDVLATAPHFLIDILDPSEHYSAWDFVRDAKQLIDEVRQRGNVPLLVGGTMMDYHALEYGLNQLPMADEDVRIRLNAQAQNIGWAAMHEKLAAIDPQSGQRIKPGDAQRIQRALEVFELSGQTMSAMQEKETLRYEGNLIKIILSADDRKKLHRRIEHRFNGMLECGFVEEVTALKQRPELNLSLPSMRCVGYRQVWQYLDGELGRDEMIFKAVVATRQLAKRQMTWLRKQSQENAFDCLNYQKDAIFSLLRAAVPVG